MQDNKDSKPAFHLSAPAIYVADLAEYNSGRLVGKWITIEGHTADTLIEEMTALLAVRGNEEGAIHDYNNLPLTSEWPDLEIVIQTAHLVTTFGYETVSAYIGYFGDEQLGQFEERYRGQYSSEEVFAQELVEECYDLEKSMGSLSNYFDYGAFARDLFMGDYVSTRVTDGVAVFSND